MKHDLETFPTCERCEVFSNPTLKTSLARASFCEGLRAAGACPKDKWKVEFEKELRELKKKAERERDFSLGELDGAEAHGKVEAFEQILGEDKP